MTPKLCSRNDGNSAIESEANLWFFETAANCTGPNVNSYVNVWIKFACGLISHQICMFEHLLCRCL
jgi:hypothetical protein